MANRINLDMTTVKNRELRLGTIIGWDGSAKELIEQSAYDERSVKTWWLCWGRTGVSAL